MDEVATRRKMEQVLGLLREEVAGIRTGRANPALIERVMVEAYEGRYPLVELATVTAPSPRQLLVAPFDASITANIERAIADHKELGLSPVVDENQIRVNIPPLSEERRRELVRLLGQKVEAGRVALRQVRQEAREGIRKAFEAKEIHEDEKFRQDERLQKLTDEYNEKIEQLKTAKEAELMEV